MTKRIILLVSVLLMLVNVCVSAESVNRDYEMLYNLNIVSETYEVYEAKGYVTQKEFIKSLIGIITEDEIPEESIIEYAQSRNIIAEIDSKEMESAVSYERALSLALNTLGYGKLIGYDGQNIESVRKYANECSLTKGVILNFGDTLNGKAMITLLANTIDANVINAVLSDKNGMFEKSDNNPLEAHREIVEITGRVTHTAYTSLYGEKGVGKNRIGINDVIYDIGYDYSEELLGQNVKAFVREEVVFHVQARNTNVKKVEIEGKDILSIADDFTKIEYEENRKFEDIKLNPALTVIYNGRNYTGYKKEDLIPSNGKIVCVDLDSDNRYDMIYVYSYETMVVKNVSTAYKLIGNIYGEGLDFSKDYLDVKIYKNGQEISYAAITVDNVLSVAKSKGDEPVLTIYVSDEKTSGTAYSFDQSEAILKLADTEYSVNQDYLDKADGSKIDQISLGNTYTFYLDAFGRIAYVKQDRLEGYEYVLIFKQKWDYAEDLPKARILNTDDEWEDLHFAKKVRYNEQNKCTAEVLFTLLGGKDLEPHVVLIMRDEEGKISAIKEPTTSNEYGAKGFTKTSEFSRYYWTGDSSFNCRHYLDYDTVVLLKPNKDEDKFDEEQYEFATVGYFSDWQLYKYVAYNVDEFGYPELYEVRDTKSTSSVTLYINKMIYSINEYGEAAKLYTGNVAGLEDIQLFEIPGSVKTEVKAGDIANVKLRNGKITELEIVYSAGGTRNYKIPVDDYKVHDGGTEVWGDVVAVDVERSMLLVDGKSEVIPIFIQSKAEIEIFDKIQRKWIIGTLSDICEGNYVRIEMGNNQVYSVVVSQ